MTVTFPAGWQAPPDCLRERIVLITGAGDGIGRACALHCARAGATVILLGRTQKKLEAVYDTILASGGAKPALVPLDLTAAGPAEFAQLADLLDDEFHRLDGLVHCAAILGDITPLENYPAGNWAQVMQVNLNAPMLLTQALMPLLRAAPMASVVFTTSSVGRRPRAFWGAYAVSKAGIESLTRLFADETEHLGTLRFNAVNPGATRTAMRARAYPAENPETLKPAEAVAPLYTWLLSEQSRQVNGCSLDAPAREETS